MAAKGTKETLASKLGLKSSGSRSVELEELKKLKEENQRLKEEKQKMKKSLEEEKMRRTRAHQHPTSQVSSAELAAVQEQLRDALQKNSHWLEYDQQRELYVQGVLSRTKELESQLHQAFQQQAREPGSDGPAQRELEAERERVQRIQAELEDVRAWHEEKSRDAARVREQLLEERRCEREALEEERRCEREALKEERRCEREALEEERRCEREALKEERRCEREALEEERRCEREALEEERRSSSERTARLQAELEDERKSVAELLMQVKLLRKSLVHQQEEQKRTTILEQQIQQLAKESEEERLDRQNLQRQLHKVLKELRKARDQISHLESTKLHRESRFSEPCSSNRMDFERLKIEDRNRSKVHSILDESFLECPICGASYPASQHRELLLHIDNCFT